MMRKGHGMSRYCKIELSALEGFEMAVVRFNQAGLMTYANRVAKDMLGVASLPHVDVAMLFPDRQAYQTVLEQMELRLQGQSSAYVTTYRRPLDGPDAVQIPISVYAFPDSDGRGNVLGSIVLVRDLRQERARIGLHNEIESAMDNEQLFAGVRQQLSTLVEFDELRIILISKGRKHLRRLYSSDPAAAEKYRLRWWPIPAFFEQALDASKPEILDIAQLRNDPLYARMLAEDASTRAFFDSGVRQIASLPVYDDNRVVGFIGIDSHQPDRYGPELLAMLDSLPLGSAVLAAVHREERVRQRAVFELMRRLGANATDVRRVAEELVECLVDNFGWEHVSIFQSSAHGDRMQLICQANSGDKSLDADLVMTSAPDASSDAGRGQNALSRAVRSQGMVNTPDTRAQGPFGGKAGFDERGSSLAVPITGHRTQWVLNVESPLLNAFAVEEIEMLSLLAQEAGEILYRSALFELQRAVLYAINDAVIETDNDGCIRWSNGAAKKMLGLEAELSSGMQIANLIDDAGLRQDLRCANDFYHRELVLRSLGGNRVPVLLSSSLLPAHLSGRVYVASDFTFQKEVQRLSELKEVFRHAALEGRVPLALAVAWLQQSRDQIGEHAADRILSQLGRADLPLQRLLRLFASGQDHGPTVAVELGGALDLTIASLPASLQEALQVEQTPGRMPVLMEFSDLQFCLESLIAFGLRTRPQAKKLAVLANGDEQHVRFRVSGAWQPDFNSEREPGPSELWRRKSLRDLTLGDVVIERLICQAGGSYRRQLDEEFFLEIELPLAQTWGQP